LEPNSRLERAGSTPAARPDRWTYLDELGELYATPTKRDEGAGGSDEPWLGEDAAAIETGRIAMMDRTLHWYPHVDEIDGAAR